MILLKSLQLSLGVLWRFLVVMVVFLPVAFVVTGAFSLIPFVGSVVSTVVSAFATLVGFRIAFQAAGVYSAPVFGRLLVGAIKWGMIETLLYAVLGTALFAIAAGAAQTLQTDFDALGPEPALGDLIALFTGSQLMQSIAIIGLGLFYLVSTLIAVPKAAAAFSAGNKAPKLPLFFGFGAGFLSILVVSLAGTLIVFYSGAFGQMFALGLHLIGLGRAAIEGAELPWLGQRDYVLMGGSVLLYVWTYCWWYAVGGLAFLKRHQRAEQGSASARSAPPQHGVDLTELRKRRMQPSLGQADEE